MCPKLAEIKTWFFLFLNFYAINASFAVVFSLNELNDSHFVLISCYLRVDAFIESSLSSMSALSR